MANDKNKTHKQYWLKNDIDKKIEDYSNLIGSTKTKLLVNIVNEYFERKIVNNEFIVPDKPFYINMKTLLEEGTVKGSINKPSRNFKDYYTVKRISNNLDSFNLTYNTYCYNENPALHKGIFVFYIFTTEAIPIPLVMDFNLFENELELSLIDLSDIILLIESEEDVKTVENIIDSVKDNIDKYNYLSDKDLDFIENPEDNFYLTFMDSISNVMEEFSGRKKIDLLVNFKINEFNTSLTESISNELIENEDLLKNNTSTEDIYNLAIKQKNKLDEINYKLNNFQSTINDIYKDIQDIEKRHSIFNSLKKESE